MHALLFTVTIHERQEADRMLHEELVPGLSQAPDQAKPPETDAFTVESFDIGEVVAHA